MKGRALTIRSIVDRGMNSAELCNAAAKAGWRGERRDLWCRCVGRVVGKFNGIGRSRLGSPTLRRRIADLQGLS